MARASQNPKLPRGFQQSIFGEGGGVEAHAAYGSPRLGVKLGLQLLAYTTARQMSLRTASVTYNVAVAMPDL